MGNMKMLEPVRKKANGKIKSDVWWLRKKVPTKYRALVGKSEVWRSLNTTDRKAAGTRCAVLSANLEADWARGLAFQTDGSNPERGIEPRRLSHQDLHALAGAAHIKTRDARIAHAGTGLAAMRWAALRDGLTNPLAEDEEALDGAVREFLKAENIEPTETEIEKFKPLFAQAKSNAYADLLRASGGDFSDSPVIKRYPQRTTPKLDFLSAFEEYAAKGGLKGGVHGPTAKRWRPKIVAFTDWLGHRDLAKATTDDGYRWMDHLIEKGFARKSIRDVWIASLSATAGFMCERRKLTQNPFRGIKVRDVRDSKLDDEKGFTAEQTKKILTATLATPSHLISIEMRAARRWVPWVCAYSGARVSEITSLLPDDVVQKDGVWCIVIKPELEKTEKHRTVPIHGHILEQGFLGYVEERRLKKLPLFFDPARARGGRSGNPQFKKVGERLAEWVHSLGIHGPQPNHGWRHLFKAVARHVGMHAEVEGFITGHSTGKTSQDYGPRWTKTMAKEIAKYPRFKIAALSRPPEPHKRIRRTRAQIAADQEAREQMRPRRRAA